MIYASLAGSPILNCRITIPMFGIWHGDIEVDGDAVVTGDVNVTIDTLSLAGHAFRTAPFVGRRGSRIVGGHGGWSQLVPAQAYQDPNGVAVSHVLGDVANACGETLVLAADSKPWSRYVRETMPGARALNQILGQTWWVDTDGSTTNKPRLTTAISSEFQIEQFDGGRGIFTLAADTIADWMPGRTFIAPTIDATQTISSVTILLDGQSTRARLEVQTNTAALDTGDRLTADMLSLIRETFPSLTFFGTYEYSVRNDGGFDPVDPSIGLPSLTSPELGLSLATATLHAGDAVRIRFVDGRPWRPELASAPATSTAITIGNAAPAAIGRVGDTIEITPTQFAAATPVANLSTGAVTITDPMQGKITSGSGQVSSG